MALWQQFDTGSTNFPQSDFKGKIIIPCSMEICSNAQYKYLPILFVALILIPNFLNSYAVLRCIDVKPAQAST
jgi:hypothetical protein